MIVTVSAEKTILSVGMANLQWYHELLVNIYIEAWLKFHQKHELNRYKQLFQAATWASGSCSK